MIGKIFGKKGLQLQSWHGYRVTKTDSPDVGWSGGKAAVGDLLVYEGRRSDPFYGTWGHSFYHTGNGSHCSLEFRRQGVTGDFDPGEFVEHQGPDMVKPDSMVDADLFAMHHKSDWELLRQHAPYLKDLVEGKPGIKNWFEWLNATAPSLTKALSRPDYLRLKGEGWSMAQKLLDGFGVSYQVSPRYRYIGYKLDSSSTNLP